MRQGPRVDLAGPDACLLGGRGMPHVSSPCFAWPAPHCVSQDRVLGACCWCPGQPSLGLLAVLQAPTTGKAAEAAQPSGRASLALSPASPASGGTAYSHFLQAALLQQPCFPNG